jgi:hypothetical protein
MHRTRGSILASWNISHMWGFVGNRHQVTMCPDLVFMRAVFEAASCALNVRPSFAMVRSYRNAGVTNGLLTLLSHCPHSYCMRAGACGGRSDG